MPREDHAGQKVDGSVGRLISKFLRARFWQIAAPFLNESVGSMIASHLSSISLSLIASNACPCKQDLKILINKQGGRKITRNRSLPEVPA
jgi:hypothetical protein